MSAEYPDTSAAILDKTLPINTILIDYDRNSDRSFVKVSSKRCVPCQWQNKPDAKVCERCGLSMFEDYQAGEQITFQGDGISAHWRTKVTKCKKTALGPGGRMVFHDLVMKQRLVVNLSYKEAHQENYCATCGTVFTWQDGRAASDSELEGCRQGKIPEKGVNRTLKP